MKAYIYEKDTKEFLYAVNVEESPLEEGVVLSYGVNFYSTSSNSFTCSPQAFWNKTEAIFA